MAECSTVIYTVQWLAPQAPQCILVVTGMLLTIICFDTHKHWDCWRKSPLQRTMAGAHTKHVMAQMGIQEVLL